MKPPNEEKKKKFLLFNFLPQLVMIQKIGLSTYCERKTKE